MIVVFPDHTHLLFYYYLRQLCSHLCEPSEQLGNLDKCLGVQGKLSLPLDYLSRNSLDIVFKNMLPNKIAEF